MTQLLTDEEIEELGERIYPGGGLVGAYQYERAIEAAVLDRLSKQEPVAFCVGEMMYRNADVAEAIATTHGKQVVPLFAAPVPPVKQEPVKLTQEMMGEMIEEGYGVSTNDWGEHLKFAEEILYRFAAHVPPVKQEPICYVTGTYGGRQVVTPLNPAMVLPENMALYAAPVPSDEPALTLYHKCMGEEDPDATPLEKLRFFLSLALQGQDWLDVEPFLNALPPDDLLRDAERYRWLRDWRNSDDIAAAIHSGNIYDNWDMAPEPEELDAAIDAAMKEQA